MQGRGRRLRDDPGGVDRGPGEVATGHLQSEADAVMIARGSLGNPWIFEELTGRRVDPPRHAEVVAELLWVIDRAGEHLGARAAAYLRKFYPWYLTRLGLPRRAYQPFQRTTTLEEARGLVHGLRPPAQIAA